MNMFKQVASNSWSPTDYLTLVLAFLNALYLLMTAALFTKERQPVLEVDLEFETSTMCKLKISNIGRNPAYNIKFNDVNNALSNFVDPNPKSGSAKDSQPFASGITYLRPGKQITYFFYLPPQKFESHDSLFSCNVTWAGSKGILKRKFRKLFEFSYGDFSDQLFQTNSDNSKSIERVLSAIRNELSLIKNKM
jgi:hypothetical protein